VDYIVLNNRMNDELEGIWKEAIWPERGTAPEYARTDCGKQRKTSVWIADVLNEIGIEYLPHTSKGLSCYRYANALYEPC
jgi:hypothetical protein